MTVIKKTTARQSRLITLLSVLLLILAGCKTRELPSNYASEPVQIDGKMTDWNTIRGHHFPDQGASIALSNDEDYLYLHFRTSNSKWARTINMTGLTLFFSSQGKEKEDFFIKLKDGPSREQLSHFRERGDESSDEISNPMRAGLLNRSFDDEPLFSCFVKDRIIEKPIPLDGTEGPAAAFDTSMGFFCYEFRVPLAEASVLNYGFGAEEGQSVYIGAEWGDVGSMNPPGNIERSMGGGGGERGSGMGGGGRGGGGKGGRGGGMGRTQKDRPEKQEIWFKTSLAVPVTETKSDQN